MAPHPYTCLRPWVEVIKQLSEELDARKDEIKRLIDQMKMADECIRECLKIKRWQRAFKAKYGGELTIRQTKQLRVSVRLICKYTSEGIC